MTQSKPEFSKQEILDTLIPTESTPQGSLEWTPQVGSFGRTLRLRMNMTRANISEEMLSAYQVFRYPESDVPEVLGLLRVLHSACDRAGVAVRLERGPQEARTGFVAYFEPLLIRLPFPTAKLALAIAPGEFQWVLTGAKKERGPDAARVEALRLALLEETREWLRRGNR